MCNNEITMRLLLFIISFSLTDCTETWFECTTRSFVKSYLSKPNQVRWNCNDSQSTEVELKNSGKIHETCKFSKTNNGWYYLCNQDYLKLNRAGKHDYEFEAQSLYKPRLSKSSIEMDQEFKKQIRVNAKSIEFLIVKYDLYVIDPETTRIIYKVNLETHKDYNPLKVGQLGKPVTIKDLSEFKYKSIWALNGSIIGGLASTKESIFFISHDNLYDQNIYIFNPQSKLEFYCIKNTEFELFTLETSETEFRNLAEKCGI